MKRNTLLAGCITASLATAGPAAAGDQHGDLQEVLITSTPLSGGLSSTAQSATVLAGDVLALRLSPTIGETVSAEPGVHSTFFGPGASRPVIRGLGGDRVLVLTDGLPTLDASGLSEDHAVAIDPALADQVEVVRGPATLLYGTGASGGIVNVVTNRIHDGVPASPEGLLELRGDTVHQERAAAGRLDAGVGRFALHLDAVWRETDDYDIPGYAQSRALRDALAAAGEELEDTRGTVPNSWTETRSGGAGVTYVADDWLLGMAYSRHDTRYGIPGGHGHHEHEEHEGEEEEAHDEGGPMIDLVQDRVDLGFQRDFGDGQRLRIAAAANDYEHAELEPSGEVGTLYEIDGREVRLAYDHRLPWDFTGTAGVQWQQVEVAATGEEAFIPDSRTRTLGAFVFEQKEFDAWTLELGARLDRQEVDGQGLAGYDDLALNLSAGTIVPLGEALSLVGQLVRIERHPSSTELHADGPHAATGQYEIGDPDLDTERGVQAEAGLRYDDGRRRAELRIFTVQYDGYIFLSPTGEVEDDLPVFRFLQQDASFYGMEASASLPLAGGWTLGLFADAVRGRLDAGGDLPRMPPLRVGGELAYEQPGWRAAVSARHSFEQDRIADNELPTDSYTMLDAELSWRPGGRADGMLLFLRATNLLDEDARVHSSPLKDEVPLPGRSIAAGVRFAFGD